MTTVNETSPEREPEPIDWSAYGECRTTTCYAATGNPCRSLTGEDRYAPHTDRALLAKPEPITADVTGSMRRGLAYDPADMTGPAVSVEHVRYETGTSPTVAATVATNMLGARRPPLARIAEPNDDPIDPGHPEAIPNALRQLLYWHSLGRVTTDRAVDRIRDLFAPGGTADLNVRLELGRILAEASVGRIQPVEAIDQILAVRRMDPSPHAGEQRAVIDQVVAGLGADERLLAHLAGQSAELVQAFVDLVGAARNAWLDPPASHEGTTEPGEVER